MVKEIFVEGYEEYVKAAAENKGKQVFALFSGSKDANGESWCPDCLTGNYFWWSVTFAFLYLQFISIGFFLFFSVEFFS